MKHPVMWFEVLGKDAVRLCEFYGSLFGPTTIPGLWVNSRFIMNRFRRRFVHRPP